MDDSRKLEFIRKTREFELDLILPKIPAGSRVLEIGAGSGWQAKVLAERGFRVEAVDVEGSDWAETRIWPVQIYDGVHLPFGDGDFDVVFSSNVLEHIPHVEKFQQEILRVLGPGGIAIHLLPTATWRIWTIVSFYPRSLQRIVSAVLRRNDRGTAPREAPATPAPPGRRRTEQLRKALLPPRHGERGNLISEIFWFSRFRWLPLFRRTGWTVEQCFPTRLFYTGGVIHGSFMGMRTRQILSRPLGSACLVYVLERPRFVPQENQAPAL
jgi:SAM-dependent methyltransferase